MKRIYISAMESSDEPFSPMAAELLDRLTAEGFELVWKKQWREYPIILDDIEACDALLAIVDEAWSSSTWISIELGYAMGLGEEQGRKNPHPMPGFVYRLRQKRMWVDSLSGENAKNLVVLNQNIEKAVAQIMTTLQNENTATED